MLLGRLVEHVRPALEAVGEYDCTDELKRIPNRATARCGNDGRGDVNTTSPTSIAECAAATIEGPWILGQW